MRNVLVSYVPVRRKNRPRQDPARARASKNKTVLYGNELAEFESDLGENLARYPAHYFVWRHGFSLSGIKRRAKSLGAALVPTGSHDCTNRWQASLAKEEARQERIAGLRAEMKAALEKVRKLRAEGRMRHLKPRTCKICGLELFGNADFFDRLVYKRGSGSIDKYWRRECRLCCGSVDRRSLAASERPAARRKYAVKLKRFAEALCEEFPLLFENRETLEVLRRTCFFRQCAGGIEGQEEIIEVAKRLLELYLEHRLNLLLKWLEEKHFEGCGELRAPLWELDELLANQPGELLCGGVLTDAGREIVLRLFRSFRLASYATHLLVVGQSGDFVSVREFGSG